MLSSIISTIKPKRMNPLKHNTQQQIENDLKRGEEGVKRVRKYIYEKYGIKSDITNEHIKKREHIDIRIFKKEHQNVDKKTYDYFVKKFGYKLEVKKDDTANRTGNIYLEIWSNVRINPPNPGTISQCRAHSIWYVLDNKFLVFDKAALLSCIITHFYFNTEKAKNWRDLTTNPFWEPTIKKHYESFHSYVDGFGITDNQIKINLMPAGINSDVRGVLIPIKEIEELREKIGLVKVIYL